jgi:alpha-amylase/alpha-mannosidase (GH57 family)
MKNRVTLFVIIGLFLLLLAACTGPTEEPTAEPTEEPTGEVTAEPTEEPTEEPAGRGPLVIEDGKLYVAIIWHQHQPVYFQDPETGIYERPWVRVHATKDYLDMAAILEQYPTIHATFNITPSLIRQLDDISAGAKDLYWVHAEIPAEELTDEQKQFIIDRFWDINPKIIDRFPRYQELAGMRNDDPLNTWTAQDWRDLQVLFNLAWTDPDWLAEEPLAGLVAKGRGFSEEDKAILFAEHLRIVQEVIPFHAAMQEAGQIEVTMTPFAHPILPLLVDSNLAQIAMPDADLPTRFVYGQDATAQVELGVQFYEEHFGIPPRGMWPAEGSVAQAVVSMISNAGIQWIATDEDVLAGSLPDVEDFTRDSRDVVQQADALYQPYLVQGSRGGPVAIIFRDKLISDKVGFTYSGMDGSTAATDFVGRLEDIQAALEEQGASGPHLVTVLLDGENAWEYYDNDGKEFLHQMYAQLSESEDIVTVTPSEYLAALAEAGQEPRRIDELWAGSWIDGTYSTWIGEEEENQAWEYLKRTRDDLQETITGGGLSEDTLAQAMMTMYIAEGSDWFWWYGADQSSGADDNFDRQFRSYLEQIYTTIGQEVPDFVYVPVIPQTAQEPDRQPADLLSAAIDGAAGEGEWDSAGYYVADEALAGGLSGIYYGFDQTTLYLRLDSPGGFADGTTYGFYISTPARDTTNAYSRYGAGETLLGFGIKRLVEVTVSGGEVTAAAYEADGAGGWELIEGDIQPSATAGADVLEIAAPFASFAPDARSGDTINIRLVVSQDEQDVAVLPTSGPALATVPDLPISNVFFDVTDPEDDDHGPGTYKYPQADVFNPGVFDILGFTAGYDDTDYIFRVQLGGTINNDWGAPNGMGVVTVDIYIDTDGPAAGDRLLLPGRNAAFTEDYGWDYAIWAEGWYSEFVQPTPDGPAGERSVFTVITNPAQRRITIRVPRSLLPSGDPTAWSYAVATMSQEGYPASGVWRIRDVLPAAEQWRLGGGTGSTNDTRIIDILLPEGSSVTQEELLTNPNPTNTAVGELSVEDFPRVVMVQP